MNRSEQTVTARLHPDRLSNVPQNVQLPGYDRAALKPGIVHLGLGAFHRAHQAVFTEDAIAHAGGDWGIIGVSMRSDTATLIITLTITEKAYQLATDGLRLDLNSTTIQRDLAQPEAPQTAIGLLALGLQRRFQAGGPALTRRGDSWCRYRGCA